MLDIRGVSEFTQSWGLHDALFPHMNVYDNIAFGLRIKKTGEDIIDAWDPPVSLLCRLLARRAGP